MTEPGEVYSFNSAYFNNIVNVCLDAQIRPCDKFQVIKDILKEKIPSINDSDLNTLVSTYVKLGVIQYGKDKVKYNTKIRMDNEMEDLIKRNRDTERKYEDAKKDIKALEADVKNLKNTNAQLMSALSKVPSPKEYTPVQPSYIPNSSAYMVPSPATAREAWAPFYQYVARQGSLLPPYTPVQPSYTPTSSAYIPTPPQAPAPPQAPTPSQVPTPPQTVIPTAPNAVFTGTLEELFKYMANTSQKKEEETDEYISLSGTPDNPRKRYYTIKKPYE